VHPVRSCEKIALFEPCRHGSCAAPSARGSPALFLPGLPSNSSRNSWFCKLLQKTRNQTRSGKNLCSHLPYYWIALKYLGWSASQARSGRAEMAKLQRAASGPADARIQFAGQLHLLLRLLLLPQPEQDGGKVCVQEAVLWCQ